MKRMQENLRESDAPLDYFLKNTERIMCYEKI